MAGQQPQTKEDNVRAPQTKREPASRQTKDIDTKPEKEEPAKE